MLAKVPYLDFIYVKKNNSNFGVDLGNSGIKDEVLNFGLKGKDISIGGRIISVADTFDAVTSDRVYRKGMSKDKATEILLEESGEQFNPEVINAFMNIVDSIKIKE
ncbi:hypothetical protein SH2C18_44610 [Clostridium sediminicola]|uniref:HD-GYP domain-containing protein n=1 Tax=Clostridium sediminicola TaxID=3114879 RepID=UPI0031F23E13